MRLLFETRVSYSMDLPSDLLEIYERIRAYGELYVVGGAVRDTLLEKVPKDYDLATNLPPEKVMIALGARPDQIALEDTVKTENYRLDLTGKSFGVVRAWTKEGNEYEIATFREDLTSGRNPDVKWATIEDDVRRRDLTVNALFYDIEAGEIVDLVGGLEDIQNGVIRAVGDPAQRFEEDPLRVLRAIRFAARMGSELDPDTSKGVAAAAAKQLSGTSPDRIQEEFIKGLASAQVPQQYVDMAQQHGLMQHIFPGLSISQNTLEKAPITSQIAALLLSNDIKQVRSTMKQMRFKGQIINKVVHLLQFAHLALDSVVHLKKDFNRLSLTDDEVAKFSAMTGQPDAATSSAYLRFVRAPPAISARELMAQGLRGPEIGAGRAKAEQEKFAQMLGESRSRILKFLLS